MRDGISDDLDRRARSICHRVICGRPTTGDLPELHEDPDLAEEVQRRLSACGLRLALAKGYGRGGVVGVSELRPEVPEQALSEPQLAALAYLYVQLDVAPAPSDHPRPRVLVHEFCKTFGAGRGWSVSYVRRAVLGPLETGEYVKVVEPGASRREAFVQPGPRMALLDRRRLTRRLERQLDADETADDEQAA